MKVVIPLQLDPSCKVLSKTSLNPHAVRLEVAVGTMVRDTCRGPGQFIHVKCGHSRLLRRPISVCACATGTGDEPDQITLVFEIRGSGTDWLARREPGDELDILGFLGNGFHLEPQGRYLLVGGGIGVPPMLGCAQSVPGRCDAVVGFRDRDHAILLDDLKACCPSVTVATEDGSLGEQGFVTSPVEKLLETNTYDAVLCCGPKAMLQAVATLAERHHVPCQVSLEERMACGVGACLGCAVRMKDGAMLHVCKDGPIFDAGEVDWTD